MRPPSCPAADHIRRRCAAIIRVSGLGFDVLHRTHFHQPEMGQMRERMIVLGGRFRLFALAITMGVPLLLSCQRNKDRTAQTQTLAQSRPPATAVAPAREVPAAPPTMEETTSRYAGKVLSFDGAQASPNCKSGHGECTDLSRVKVLSAFQVSRGERLVEQLMVVDENSVDEPACHACSPTLALIARERQDKTAQFVTRSFDLEPCCGWGQHPDVSVVQIGKYEWAFTYVSGYTAMGAVIVSEDIEYFDGSGVQLTRLLTEYSDSAGACAVDPETDCEETIGTVRFEQGSNPTFFDLRYVLNYAPSRGNDGPALPKSSVQRNYRMEGGQYRLVSREPSDPSEPPGSVIPDEVDRWSVSP